MMKEDLSLRTLVIVTLMSATGSAADKLKPFEFGVGIFGGGGVVGLTKPTDTTFTLNGAKVQDPNYPGFFGASGGAGVMLDARMLEAVGVEVDLYYAFSERGKGSLNAYSLEIGQSALHIPVLLKGTLPFGSVRPFLAVGPEFVLPGTAAATLSPVPPAGGTAFGAEASTYTLITAALGAEIRLPLKGIDVRIPFSLRFGKNLSTSDSIVDRRSASLTGSTFTRVSYKSEWELQGTFTLGAALYF